MIKYFCDCCKKEISKSRNLYPFSYYLHIDLILNNNPRYVDSDFDSISGRSENVELCISCYNRIVIESVKKFQELKSKNVN